MVCLPSRNKHEEKAEKSCDLSIISKTKCLGIKVCVAEQLCIIPMPSPITFAGIKQPGRPIYLRSPRNSLSVIIYRGNSGLKLGLTSPIQQEVTHRTNQYGTAPSIRPYATRHTLLDYSSYYLPPSCLLAGAAFMNHLPHLPYAPSHSNERRYYHHTGPISGRSPIYTGYNWFQAASFRLASYVWNCRAANMQLPVLIFD